MVPAHTIPAMLSGKLDNVANIAERRTGKRPSPPTVWRWCRQGLRGGTIKLAALYHGGAWRTTDEAFEQFVIAQTEAAFASGGEPESASDDDLRAAGLL